MDQLETIVSQVLRTETGRINNDLSRDNAEEWDSFNHLVLISEIEKQMRIKFTLSEVEKIKNFGQLKDVVASKK